MSRADCVVIEDDALRLKLANVQGTADLQLLQVDLGLGTSLGSQWKSWWQEEMCSPAALPNSLLFRGWPNGISVCPKTGCLFSA